MERSGAISGKWYPTYQRPSTPCTLTGGGFVKSLVAGFSLQKNWTLLDLRFCENEGSKRFRINEKGSIGSTITEKTDTECLKSIK